MSDTNGTPEKPQDRLARVEASHVQLMTDHELFVRQQEAAWARHEKFVEEQNREWERQQERWKQQDARDKALGERIDKLVSGIGEFIRQGK